MPEMERACWNSNAAKLEIPGFNELVYTIVWIFENLKDNSMEKVAGEPDLAFQQLFPNKSSNRHKSSFF